MTTPEIAKVKKRDGSIVDFEQDRISKAIFKALTVSGEGDEKLAEKLAERVIKILNRRFSKREIPDVEQIQDIVEEVLMLEELTQTAKAYIIYREQRRRMRETETIYDEAVEIYDKYINEIDWQVKENANMAYSLQGLNNYGVGTLTKRYWLNKIYPQQIREAAASGDFHIHDLDFLGAYCCGWDLYDLLKRGFGGVAGKVESKPPKHLRAALGQVVNFFYTLQGETAGAVAFSNLDTLLAPFIRYDKLDYKDVKQAMQEFLFGCAVPTRVGFQCLSQDTEILTPDGWKKYREIKTGETIKTFNIGKGAIEDKEVKDIFNKEYQGVMYNLKTLRQDQLISPGHRVVMKNGDGSFSVQPIEDVLKTKSSIFIPIILQEGEIEIDEIFPEAIKEVSYQGIIWCPNTDNETVIAKRNGQVFITGNTPFSNITIDITPSPSYAKQPVIIGGELQKETYGEFAEEMKVFNKAFFEVMLEGDKNSRIFTFPIPTVNITKDFPWDEPFLEPMWLATAKYGICYFANFLQSDMKPEDVRSMCKMPSCQIIYKNAEGEIAKTEIRRIVDDFLTRGNSIEILSNGDFYPVKDVVKLKIDNADILRVTLDNGLIDKMTLDHPSLIIKDGKLVMVASSELNVGDEFPIAKHPYQGELGDFELGRILGLYIGDGWLSHNDATVNFVFNKKERVLVDFVSSLAIKRFSARVSEFVDEKHNYCRVSVASKALAELMKEYIRGKNSLEKRINSKTFARHIDFRRGVVVGIIESDGSVNKKLNFVALHSSNGKLIHDILVLFRSLGLNTTFFASQNKTGLISKIGYTLRLGGDTPTWLMDYFGLRKGNSLKYKDYGDFYGVKIKEIKKIKYSGYVYDFEINSKQHIFQLANGIMTHNCCRLRLNNKELLKRGGGLFGANPLTGSLGVVTIGMSRLGYLSKTKKEFFERLARVMDLAKESLEIKRKAIDDLMRKGLYPYSKHYLQDVEKMRGTHYGNHFSTIGILGMNECLLNFMGEDIGSLEGRKFTLEVMDSMRERIIKYQEETGNLYNLESTPAEGASFKLALKDREKYPEIITAGTTEVPYYTNSSLPYSEKILVDGKLIEIGGFVEEHLEKDTADHYTFSYHEGKIIKSKILGVVKHEPKSKLFLITTNSGREIKVTGNHSVFWFNPATGNVEPKIVYDFSKGDSIIVFKGPFKTSDLEFVETSKIVDKPITKNEDFRVGFAQRNHSLVNNRIQLDYDFGFICGINQSDGSVLNSANPQRISERVSFCFDNKKEINAESVAVQVKEITDARPYFYFNPTYTILDYYSRNFAFLCKALGLQGKRVPEAILRGPEECKIGYLDGFVIGDGYVNIDNIKKYHYIEISQNQRDILSDISLLLSSLGIYHTINGPNQKGMFYLRICRSGLRVFARLSKLSSAEITEEHIKSSLPCNFGVVEYLIKKYSGGKKWRVLNELGAEDKYVGTDKIQEFCKAKNEDRLFELLDNFLIDTVKEIEEISEPGDHYDISTQYGNFYGKDGILCHNTQLPVNYTDDVFKAVELQDEIQCKYTGGVILHLFIGEQLRDLAAMKSLIKKIFSNYKLPYITLTPTFSICPLHGYLSGEHWQCPKCIIEQPCEVYSRVVGYIRPVQQWHKGKAQEFKERKTFQVQ